MKYFFAVLSGAMAGIAVGTAFHDVGVGIATMAAVVAFLAAIDTMLSRQ